MRFAVLGLMLCAAGAVAEPGAEVGAMFRKNCAPCHVVPDKTLKTDLAWLDQINRTT